MLAVGLAACSSPQAGDPHRIVEFTFGGQVVNTFHSGLEGNHVMEFAVDPSHSRIYPIGPCEYAGGLSRIDLSSGTTRLLVPPSQNPVNEPPKVCGSRARMLPGRGTLVLAATSGVPHGEKAAAAALFVDAQSGRVEQRVPLPAPAADLLALPR